VPNVGYVGGSNFDGSFSFADDGRLCHYDALILGFTNEWSARHGCTGPIEPNLGAMPNLHTNGCIQKGAQFLSPSEEWRKCGLIAHCGGGGEGTVGSAVLAYQQRGKRLLLSIGGANSQADNMDAAKGPAFARALWSMYLGGEDPKYKGWRPFGEQVVLDGIDLDLEQTPAACNANPSSPACKDVQEGWWAFVNTMRNLMDNDPRKEYLITAVPINTKFSDPKHGGFAGWGAYTHGYLPQIGACPDEFTSCGPAGCPLGSPARAALDAQPTKSLFAIMHKIDYLWPQYYPSPTSITMNDDTCWHKDYSAWAALAIHAAERTGEPNRNRVGVGLPYNKQAAPGGGQIDAAVVISKVMQASQETSIGLVLKAKFGGMMGWDEFWDHTANKPKGFSFARQLADGLASQSFLALIDDNELHEVGRVCAANGGLPEALREGPQEVELAGGDTPVSLGAAVGIAIGGVAMLAAAGAAKAYRGRRARVRTPSVIRVGPQTEQAPAEQVPAVAVVVAVSCEEGGDPFGGADLSMRMGTTPSRVSGSL